MQQRSADIFDIRLDESLLNQDGDDIEANRMRNLWLAVLLRIFSDAVNNINTKRDKRRKTMCREWLVSLMDDDFITVCDMAGINPMYAKQCFRKFFKDMDII